MHLNKQEFAYWATAALERSYRQRGLEGYPLVGHTTPSHWLFDTPEFSRLLDAKGTISLDARSKCHRTSLNQFAWWNLIGYDFVNTIWLIETPCQLFDDVLQAFRVGCFSAHFVLPANSGATALEHQQVNWINVIKSWRKAEGKLKERWKNANKNEWKWTRAISNKNWRL